MFKLPAFDGVRHKKLMETTPDDFLAVFNLGKPSIIEFLKRLHNFALSLGLDRHSDCGPTRLAQV